MQITDLFTRQEMALLTGIADDVLAFWIKNDLLVPSSGGAGKGSHRKFAGFQVNIAGVLAELRNNGINIAGLRAFASQLQRGTALCETAECNFATLAEAVELRWKVEAFKRSESVIIGVADGVSKLASSVSEIVEDFFFDPRYRQDKPENIAAFANRITSADFNSIRLFEALNGCGYAHGNRDEEWMAIRAPNDDWKIITTMQAGRSSAMEGRELRSGLYLWIGNIVAEIWGSRLNSIHFEDLPMSEADQARLAILEKRFADEAVASQQRNAEMLARAAVAAKHAGTGEP